MISEARRFRMGLWAVVFFILAISMPGWFIQMRLIQKLGRLEKRITELEMQMEALPAGNLPVTAE